MELSVIKLVKGISVVAYPVVAIVTSVTVLLASFLIFIIIFPIRQIVKLLLHYQFKNRFQIMGPLDSLLCTYTGQSSLMITGCFQAQVTFGPENLANLRSKLYSKIVSSASGNYRKLQFVPRIKFGFRCWEDVQFLGGFDVKTHVKIFPGEEAWDKIYSETQLDTILNAAINQKSLTSKGNVPKWEVLIVPQVSGKKSSPTVAQTNVALIVRVCHGYMDGNYFAKFLKECIFDNEIESQSLVKVLSKRAKWSFSRIAVYYLKLFCFGAFDGMRIRFSKGFEATRILQKGIGYGNNAFIGKVKMDSETVRKIKNVANCQTVASVFCTAFLAALRTFAEQKDVEVPNRVNVGLTRVVPAGEAHDKPNNRFAFYGRELPASLMIECSNDMMKEMLKTTDNLILTSPDNEYEIVAGFYIALLIGFLPDLGIRPVGDLFSLCSCLISLTPLSDQILQFQGGLVTSGFGVPPYGYGTCYSLGISNYTKDFYATLLVAKSSLVQSQFEFQELLCQFHESMRLLHKIT